MDTKACTPLFLQKSLVDEMRTILQEMTFMKPNSGGKRVQMNVYRQNLPIPSGNKKRTGETDDYKTIDYIDELIEDPVFDCPWCVVKINNGNIPGINEMQEAEVGICFGIFDDDPSNQGHQDILNLIQKTYQRFSVNPLLGGQYTCTGTFEWALQESETDTFPYFFGAIGTTFKFQGLRRENKYL